MATQKDQEKDNAMGLNEALLTPQQQQAQEKPEQQQPQPQQLSNVSAPSQTTAPTITKMPAPQQKGTGTFANLKSYLEANKGANIASAAAQKVQKSATGTQKALQQAGQEFQSRVQAGSLANEEQALQDVKNTLEAARRVTYQTPQDTTQPQQYLTPEQQRRFQETITAQYAGPASLQQTEAYNPLLERAKATQRLVEQAQSPTKRGDLLKEVFGKGREYTTGQSKLDELLLGGSQAGVEQLQQTARQAGNVQKELEAAGIETANIAKQRAADIAGIQQEARKEFTTQQTAEETATEKRITDLIETPAKDANGKKIPKLDANGKPLKVNGVVQYQTEWDRLPEYFKGLLSEKSKKEAVEKAIKEQESALYGQYRGTISQRANTLKNIKQLEQDLKKYEEQSKLTYEPSAAWGMYDPNTQRRMAEQEKARIDKLVLDAQKQLGILNPKLEETRKLLAGIESGKYKEYQKALEKARGMSKEQLLLSPEEAAVLGMRAGEGLYTLGPEAIKTAIAQRERLATKDEVARQLALAQLAGLDPTKALKAEAFRGDLGKAGTQTLTSSLDTKALRRALEEEQKKFLKSAEGTELVGKGKKKVSRGNWAGKKTKTYKAEVSAEVADLLSQAGVDVNKLDEKSAKSLLTNKDLLNKFIGAIRTERGEQGNIGYNTGEGAAAGATTGYALGGGTGAAIGATVGSALGSNSVDPNQITSDLYNEMGRRLGIPELQAVGQGVQDIRGAIASPFSGLADSFGNSLVGDIFGGISGAIGGINEGEMRAVGESTAKKLAIEDLKKKYEDYLNKWNFENRANIVDTEATKARTEALKDLLLRRG